jgi:hypothetical protein
VCASTLVVQPITNRFLKCQRTTAGALLPSGNNTPRFQFLQPALSRAPVPRGPTSGIDPCPKDFGQPLEPISLWALVLGHWTFARSFPCANPRTKAPRLATSLCMVCMVWKEIGSETQKTRLAGAVQRSEFGSAATAPKVRRTAMSIESDPRKNKITLPTPSARAPASIIPAPDTER